MDWTNLAVVAIGGLTAAVTMLVVWAVKLGWSRLPAVAVFILAPVAGALVQSLLVYISALEPADPVRGAVFGLLSVVLRELLSTFQAKGINGPVTPTKGML